MGQSRPLFVYFSFFSQCKDKYCTNSDYKWYKHRLVLGTRTRDAKIRRRQIHWTMFRFANETVLICPDSLSSVIIPTTFAPWALVVAQLAEWSFLIQEVRGSNAVIGKKLYWTYLLLIVKKSKSTKKRSVDQIQSSAKNCNERIYCSLFTVGVVTLFLYKTHVFTFKMAIFHLKSRFKVKNLLLKIS